MSICSCSLCIASRYGGSLCEVVSMFELYNAFDHLFIFHVLKDRFSNRKQVCCEYAFLVSGLRLGCCAYNKLQLCLFLVYSVNFRWFSCGCFVIHPQICFELSPEYCVRIHKFLLHESFVGLSNDLLSDLGCQRSGYCDFGTVCSFGEFAPILYLV